MTAAHRPAPGSERSGAAPRGPRNPAAGSSSRGLARIAVFAALIAVMGLAGPIPVPVIPVPITLQTLGVMLAGAVLGPWRGLGAVLLFEALVALGLPLLSGGRGGLGVFVAPSAGFLLGWILGVVVVGLIVRAGARRPVWWRGLLGCVVGGIAAIYLLGIPVQSLVTGLGLRESALASMVFLPGDLLKAVLATAITMGLWRAYPRAFE
ncbi:biotin transporter BioY [Rothia sp. AR01]|uniref:Biotin transporter n=1 Tax=Rothia santali TaxID=2949643 RepID=A0A9X2HL85_9MICC|nr:ECF transporter S component [Rothia santali]MCP3426313.1 biotin transporter BioY [Rothia santali]